jgi:Fe-S oxidoreductase
MKYEVPDRPVNRGCNGVYDAPRNILRSIDGVDFVELYRIREYSFCCGGGGGVPKAYPELAGSAALHRMEEARDVGADHLVTACHQCRITLKNAQETARQDSMPVLDIIDLVHEAAAVQE